MTTDTIVVSAPAQPERAFARALGNAVSDVKGIAGLLLALTGMIAAYVALRDAIHLDPPWPIIGCLIPVPIFLFFYVWPEWKDSRARASLQDLGIRGRLKEPGYFRLVPYEETETEKYDRPDKADEAVIQWITRSTSPVLYLSGQSGVGKSSLLNASVFPKLRQQDPVWIVVAVRPHDDPVGAIRTALSGPTGILQPPPSADTDLLALIDQAVQHATSRKRRLLIAIDQFEEVFILSDDTQHGSLIALLRDLVARPRDGLTLLLSLRSEYLSDIENLPIPAPTFGRNCFEVRPFTQAAARDFLERSEINLGPGLMNEVFDEIAEIEDMPDRVRPVVLNMVGLVLASFRGALPKGVSPGRLLSGYVRRCLSAADVRFCAVPILQPLVTAVGTKRALPLSTIAEKAGVSIGVARGCLIRLADYGLVRTVDQSNESWEIAHDFVARLVQPIVQHWRNTAWDAARPWLAPASLIVWLIVLGFGTYIYPSWHDERIRRELDHAGLVPAPQPSWGGKAFKYNGQIVSETLFRKATTFFAKLHGPITRLDFGRAGQLRSLEGSHIPTSVRSLILSQTGLTTLKGMPPLPNLTELVASHIPLTNLGGLPTLPALEKLQLDGTALTSLAGMPVLPALTEFNLEGVPLITLAGMPSQPNLTRLILRGSGLKDMAAMPVLPSLETLDLERAQLTTLAGMPSQPNLTQLILRATPLKDLTAMPILPSLKTLVVDVGNVSAIPVLPSLEMLTLAGSLKSLSGMPAQPNLKTLVVRSKALSDLVGMPSLPALETLSLAVGPQIKLKGMPILPKLRSVELSAWDNPDLTFPPGFISMEVTSGLLAQLSLTELKLRRIYDLAGFPSFPNLSTLTLVTPLIKSLQGMPLLPSLEALTLSDADQLTSLEAMPVFPKLKRLSLRNSWGPRDLTGMPPQPALAELDVSGMKELRSLSTLSSMKNLKNLTIGATNINIIPDDLKLETLKIVGQAQGTFQTLERFKATLGTLVLLAEPAGDFSWSGLTSLSNLEILEVPTLTVIPWNELRMMARVTKVKISQPVSGTYVLSASEGADRRLTISLPKSPKNSVQIMPGSKLEIIFEEATTSNID